MTQVVEYLSSKHESLNSISSAFKKDYSRIYSLQSPRHGHFLSGILKVMSSPLQTLLFLFSPATVVATTSAGKLTTFSSPTGRISSVDDPSGA
jgi:hypothetical protein